MAFRELTSLDADTTISLGGYNKKSKKENPTRVEGYFLGSKDVPSKLSKSGFCKLHYLQTPKGNVGVWGKADLDRKLSQVTPGTMIRATQDGTKPTKNGSDMYLFKVEVDNDNTIEVNINESAPAAVYTADVDDSTDNDDTDTDDNDSYTTPAVNNVPAAVAADRKAQVAALLAKTKGK